MPKSMSADTRAPAIIPFEPAPQALAVEPVAQPGVESSARKWFVGVLIMALGALAFTIDVPVSQMMVEGSWPQPVRRLRKPIHDFLGAIEPFGQPTAVIAVSLAVLLCAGPGRGVAFRIFAGAVGAGLCVDVLKIIVARVRPRHFNFQGTVSDTFHSLFPGSAGGSHIQSWPSGHTAMAVGFCLALSSVFPRGRWLFITLAVLVALQRIESGAHYLSDTLFATAVAYGLWTVVFGRGPVGRFFDRIESKWADR